jgi:SAM-dependent methyltransferase
MSDAGMYWRDQLAEWAIPGYLTAAVDESPWALPVDHFVRRALRCAAHPVGSSYARAVQALQQRGSVLDVGAGAGAASLPLLRTGRVTDLTAVDINAEMLDALREHATVPTRAITGRWPDVAPATPAADVVVCHHVFYNVPDLGDFARALTAHARRRVVVELTESHPLVVLNPLWLRFHGLVRPAGPTAADAVAVLREQAIFPHEERWHAAEAESDITDSDVESTRRRLCLPPRRRDEVADALRIQPPEQLGRVTLWWQPGAPADAAPARELRGSGAGRPGWPPRSAFTSRWARRAGPVR